MAQYHGDVIHCPYAIPQVATVGMDKALRLWNFQDKSSQLVRFFDEAPLAISLHPSGMYLVLSFGEKVHL